MLYRSSLVVFVVLIVAIATLAQDSPAPSPSPKPAAKRRGLDQFGLSNGILASGSPMVDSSGSPATVEPVDKNVFDTIGQLGESALFLQEELARGLRENVEISAGSPFRVAAV